MMKTYLMNYTYNIMARNLYMSGLRPGNKVYISYVGYRPGQIDITYYFISSDKQYIFQTQTFETIDSLRASVFFAGYKKIWNNYEVVAMNIVTPNFRILTDPETDQFYYHVRPKYYLKAIKHEPGMRWTDLLADTLIVCTCSNYYSTI